MKINNNIQKPETCTEFYRRKNKNNISELTNEEIKELNEVLEKYIKYLEQKYIDEPDDEPEKITIIRNKEKRSYNVITNKNNYRNIKYNQLKKIICYKFKDEKADKCRTYRELKAWCKLQKNIITEFIDEEETLIV